jgi:hypothetical protein
MHGNPKTLNREQTVFYAYAVTKCSSRKGQEKEKEKEKE